MPVYGRQFCQLTRDGEVYHEYCLNYSKAMTYLERLRKNEDFCEFEKVSKSAGLFSPIVLVSFFIRSKSSFITHSTEKNTALKINVMFNDLSDLSSFLKI